MKTYILRAQITIIEVPEPEPQEHRGDSMEKAAALATRVMSGVPLIAPMMVSPNTYEMSKAVQISGSGIATVAEVLKHLDAALDQIAIETV